MIYLYDRSTKEIPEIPCHYSLYKPVSRMCDLAVVGEPGSYRARAASSPAPTIPNAMSGRAAAPGVSEAEAEAVAEAAKADETRLEAAATSVGSGLSLTSVQILFARSVAAIRDKELAQVYNRKLSAIGGYSR